MTEEQQAIFDAILVVLRGIAPEAALDLKLIVEDMMTDEDREWLFEHIVEADQYAYSWQGSWVVAARTWLLLAIVHGPPRMSYDPPNRRDMNRWLGQLRTASWQQVMDGVKAQLMGVDMSQQAIAEVNAILTDASRDAWDPAEFTDPSSHRPDRYCYIITALRSTQLQIADAGEIQFLEANRANFVSRSTQQPGLLIYDVSRYYLTDPTAISSEVLSCSVISHDKKHLYQNMCFGLVLRVPQNNICAAGARDLVAASVQNTARGQNLHGLSEYRRAAKITKFLNELAGKAKRDLPTPDEVLDATSVNGHNELIVLGTFLGQVQVSALFVKVNGGRVWQAFLDGDRDGTLRALMLSFARAHEIPIIPIPDESGRASSEEFDVWVGRRAPDPARRDVSGSDSRAVVLARQDRIVREDAPDLKLTLGKARALLAQQLNVSVFTDLSELHRIYLRFAMTHHPDKTEDEERQKKFVFVRNLLTLVEEGESGDGPPKAITFRD